MTSPLERQPGDMSQAELVAEALRLSEHRAQKFISEDRKIQLTQRIGELTFEFRYQSGEFQGQPVVLPACMRSEPTPEQLKEFNEATGYGDFAD